LWGPRKRGSPGSLFGSLGRLNKVNPREGKAEEGEPGEGLPNAEEVKSGQLRALFIQPRREERHRGKKETNGGRKWLKRCEIQEEKKVKFIVRPDWTTKMGGVEEWENGPNTSEGRAGEESFRAKLTYF